ncbi:disease resistance protein PIK6-NP-like [Phragmites australis]|uniref:disease resistance protein PIK6-NP-like n=1 Tax=Phragmites australis TaxID=29695 RepID=UPI002D77DC0A|nr:disease resistance protein PIK6-NP-like [Phragmites australis]
MADQTHGAVDSLLGLLSSAIKDEARLLGGVQGDIQFIKDEMESMNGFLLHLTKTDTPHDDQVRAWMKQVRDIAYIAQDIIELYKRDLRPPGSGLWALVRHVPVYLRTMPARHRLATKISELKVRVRDVGERRQRYGVTVPDSAALKPTLVDQDGKTDEKREDFLRALEDDHNREAPCPSFSTAIAMLPCGLASEAGSDIQGILEKCLPDHVDSMKMLLRALYAYPYGTKDELQKLLKKLTHRSANVKWEVMVFCYGKLSTHYKSCLQYLTAFLQEIRISRTSLVRRWVAEGLVAKYEGAQPMEEAGERCFNELVFRGFICPENPGATGLKIKSCKLDDSVGKFIMRISESENFVAGALPTHLRHQVEIRKIVQRQPPPEKPWPRNIWDDLCIRVPRKQLDMKDIDDSTAADGGKLHPMDDMVNLLKSLPKEYRLNVLDLGGCKGLKKRYLKSICEVLSLKYLCLRNTDVSRLPRQINNLWKLETLDIRHTVVPPADTEHIFLPNLKHFLAGQIIRQAGDKTESFRTVRMPRKIGKSTEILRHVEISRGEVDLERIGHQKQLRKMGVVLDGSGDNIKHLLRTITKLSECLRSLSVWITPSDKAGDEGVTLNSEDSIVAAFSPPKQLESLNIRFFNSGVPSWIRGLENLSKITLRDTQVTREGMRTLGELQGLRCLRLRHGSLTENSITLDKGEFKNLRFLLIDQVSIITAQDGAAPKLEKIVWTFDRMEITQDTISGINHLHSLKELELHGEWNDPGGHMKQAIAGHPNRPSITGTPVQTRLSGPPCA